MEAHMPSYLSHNEIHTQYTALEKTLDYIVENTAPLQDFFANTGDIVMVACGSSYWLSLSAHKTIKLKTGRRAYAVKAGDVVLCQEEYAGMYDNPVFLCPSRSGFTGELLDAIDILQKLYPGAKLFSITEYENNKLAAKSDMALSIPWANEESVCQTRSFSCLYLAFTTLGAILGKDIAFIQKAKTYLKSAPELYLQHENEIQKLAYPSSITGLVALGGGLQYGVAIEGAYIVIEMAEYPASYYQLLEYRHGPIVTAGGGTAVFICGGLPQEHEAKMAQEIRATGAKVYVVKSGPAADYADYTFSCGDVNDKEIIAMHYIFIMQSFAYHFSVARGKNPDSPGNLVPFIIY